MFLWGKYISFEIKAQYVALLKSKPPHQGVSERGAARTLNQWLKRTILKIDYSHPMSCYLSPKPLDDLLA
jgi:hypothetical protein